MSSFSIFLSIVPILAFILLGVNLIFAPHNPYLEKNSAFECGYHSFLWQNRTQFSISFFIFALLFLLFDLEILLVYPYVVSGYSNGVYGLIIMLIFFSFLTLGFHFELGKKALVIYSRQNLGNKKKSPYNINNNYQYKQNYSIFTKKLIQYDKDLLTINYKITKYNKELVDIKHKIIQHNKNITNNHNISTNLNNFIPPLGSCINYDHLSIIEYYITKLISNYNFINKGIANTKDMDHLKNTFYSALDWPGYRKLSNFPLIYYKDTVNLIIGDTIYDKLNEDTINRVKSTIDIHNKKYNNTKLSDYNYNKKLKVIDNESSFIPGINKFKTPLNGVFCDKPSHLPWVFSQEWIYGTFLFIWEFYMLYMAYEYLKYKFVLNSKSELPICYKKAYNQWKIRQIQIFISNFCIGSSDGVNLDYDTSMYKGPINDITNDIVMFDEICEDILYVQLTLLLGLDLSKIIGNIETLDKHELELIDNVMNNHVLLNESGFNCYKSIKLARFNSTDSFLDKLEISNLLEDNYLLRLNYLDVMKKKK